MVYSVENAIRKAEGRPVKAAKTAKKTGKAVKTVEVPAIVTPLMITGGAALLIGGFSAMLHVLVAYTVAAIGLGALIGGIVLQVVVNKEASA